MFKQRHSCRAVCDVKTPLHCRLLPYKYVENYIYYLDLLIWLPPNSSRFKTSERLYTPSMMARRGSRLGSPRHLHGVDDTSQAQLAALQKWLDSCLVGFRHYLQGLQALDRRNTWVIRACRVEQPPNYDAIVVPALRLCTPSIPKLPQASRFS